MDDPYLQARSADVMDIAQAMLDILQGTDVDSMQGTEPSILVAEDLAPSETVRLDKSLLLGFVTREGSTNSHTAILARQHEHPCPDPVQGDRRHMGTARWLSSTATTPASMWTPPPTCSRASRSASRRTRKSRPCSRS